MTLRKSIIRHPCARMEIPSLRLFAQRTYIGYYHKWLVYLALPCMDLGTMKHWEHVMEFTTRAFQNGANNLHEKLLYRESGEGEVWLVWCYSLLCITSTMDSSRLRIECWSWTAGAVCVTPFGIHSNGFPDRPSNFQSSCTLAIRPLPKIEVGQKLYFDYVLSCSCCDWYNRKCNWCTR